MGSRATSSALLVSPAASAGHGVRLLLLLGWGVGAWVLLETLWCLIIERLLLRHAVVSEVRLLEGTTVVALLLMGREVRIDINIDVHVTTRWSSHSHGGSAWLWIGIVHSIATSAWACLMSIKGLRLVAFPFSPSRPATFRSQGSSLATCRGSTSLFG